MNLYIIIIAVISVIGVPLFVIGIHDNQVQLEKNTERYKKIRDAESCSDLKSDIKFLNDLNNGIWIKQYDDSDVLKRYKEKNCS